MAAEMRSNEPKPTANEVLEWTSPEAVRRIRTGAISAEGYASQLLNRYRDSTGLKAITWIDEDAVLKAARAVDDARQKGQPLGPLAGLPFVAKDNINTVGFPTTAGTPTLKEFLPPRNAPVINILLENGAILFGKANMHELGRGVTNSNLTFGATANPYDTKLIPGGGAGGTAAAIAARITPAGLGSDTAGSARIPASFCGIAGLRPSTAGRPKAWTLASWPASSVHDGVFPISFSITTPAPMGRTVADVALLNAVITGEEMPNPLLSDQPPDPGAPERPLKGVRLGVPRGFYWEDVDPEVLQVLESALDKLRVAGATLLDVNLRQWAMAAHQAFFILSKMDNLQDMAAFLSTHGSSVTLDQLVSGVAGKDVQTRLHNIIGNPVTEEQARDATNMRRKLALTFEQVLRKDNDVSAIVYPTVAVLPPAIREADTFEDKIELNGRQVDEFATILRNTHLSGVVGIPSLAVPAGVSSGGLPVALSFESVIGSDADLLRLGLSVEAIFGRVPAPPLQPTA